MPWPFNPLRGNTINRRAGCGRSARPVRREGELITISSPYPYQIMLHADRYPGYTIIKRPNPARVPPRRRNRATIFLCNHFRVGTVLIDVTQGSWASRATLGCDCGTPAG